MDAMDEFQEADVLWPDAEDDELVPYVTVDMVVVEEPYGASVSSVASVLGRRFEGSFFLPGAAGPSSSSAGASPDADDDEEEWLEADVLWPDTMHIMPRGGGGCSQWPFPGGSGRAGRQVSPADRWRPAASSPIDIPTVAARRRFGSAMSRRS